MVLRALQTQQAEVTPFYQGKETFNNLIFQRHL